ncbi:GNAT family N-acetyltransferase [Streptomyces sp. KL110A]|uniref:GNAT family N-acetyltransferase n=1 Tax=Streptomyces sp. KL110A TaxID=3384221 RepID=UPI0038C41009
MALRSLTAADAPAVRRIYGKASVRFLGRAAMTGREAQEYVARVQRWHLADPVEQYVLGVDIGCDLVGVVKLGLRPGRHGRVSYVLREGCWGQGYATQAVRELVSFASTTAGLVSLGARHHPDNAPSGRVLAKAGFTRIGARDGMTEYSLLLDR